MPNGMCKQENCNESTNGHYLFCAYHKFINALSKKLKNVETMDSAQVAIEDAKRIYEEQGIEAFLKKPKATQRGQNKNRNEMQQRIQIETEHTDTQTHKIIESETKADGSVKYREESTTRTIVMKKKMEIAITKFQERYTNHLTNEFEKYTKIYQITAIPQQSSLSEWFDLPWNECLEKHMTVWTSILTYAKFELPIQDNIKVNIWRMHSSFLARLKWLESVCQKLRKDALQVNTVVLDLLHVFQYVCDIHKAAKQFYRDKFEAIEEKYQVVSMHTHFENGHLTTIPQIDYTENIPPKYELDESIWRDPIHLMLSMFMIAPNAKLCSRDGRAAIFVIEEFMKGNFSFLKNALLSTQIIARCNANLAFQELDYKNENIQIFGLDLVPNKYTDMFCYSKQSNEHCFHLSIQLDDKQYYDVILPKQVALAKFPILFPWVKENMIPHLVETKMTVQDDDDFFKIDNIKIPMALLQESEFDQILAYKNEQEKLLHQRKENLVEKNSKFALDLNNIQQRYL